MSLYVPKYVLFCVSLCNATWKLRVVAEWPHTTLSNNPASFQISKKSPWFSKHDDLLHPSESWLKLGNTKKVKPRRLTPLSPSSLNLDNSQTVQLASKSRWIESDLNPSKGRSCLWMTLPKRDCYFQNCSNGTSALRGTNFGKSWFRSSDIIESILVQSGWNVRSDRQVLHPCYAFVILTSCRRSVKCNIHSLHGIRTQSLRIPRPYGHKDRLQRIIAFVSFYVLYLALASRQRLKFRQRRETWETNIGLTWLDSALFLFPAHIHIHVRWDLAKPPWRLRMRRLSASSALFSTHSWLILKTSWASHVAFSWKLRQGYFKILIRIGNIYRASDVKLNTASKLYWMRLIYDRVATGPAS